MTQPDDDSPYVEPTYYDPTIVRIQHPDDEFRLAGTLTRPLALNDGEGWRVWPGEPKFLKQLMPDGTWRDVVWTA